MMTPTTHATLIGLLAPLSWSVMPLLVSIVSHIPPFALTAYGFGLSCLGFAVFFTSKGHGKQIIAKIQLKHIGLALWGIFGFHFFYFQALYHAPIVQAFLIVEIWPVLLVALGVFVGHIVWRWHLGLGMLLACAGVVLSVVKFDLSALVFKASELMGYVSAFAAAVVMTLYSFYAKRWNGSMKTEYSVVFFGIASVAALFCHLAFEEPITLSMHDWAWLIIIAAAPMGGSFLWWIHGMQQDNMTILSMSGFAIPLLGSLWLVIAGVEPWHPAYAPALLLLVVGSVIATPRNDSSAH